MYVLIFGQYDFKVPIHGPLKILWGSNGMGGEGRETRQGKGREGRGKRHMEQNGEKREGNEVGKGEENGTGGDEGKGIWDRRKGEGERDERRMRME